MHNQESDKSGALSSPTPEIIAREKKTQVWYNRLKLLMEPVHDQNFHYQSEQSKQAV